MTILDDELARRFVPRAVWGARRPERVTRFDPDFGDTLHYEGVNLGVFAHTSCASKVRGIQNYHMDAKNWVDVAYSDLACPHGFVFEGRGVGVRTAANGTDEGNDSAHATCALLGPKDAVTDELIWAMAVSAARLNRAVGLDGINGHRNWKATACPGDPLYAHLPIVRGRASSLLTEPAPPIVVPPAYHGPTLSEDSVHTLLVNVPVDGNRGYTDLRAGAHGLTRAVSPFGIVGSPFFADDDPGDGWDDDLPPGRPPTVANVGGVARVIVRDHSVARGAVGVYITIAD